MDAVINFVNQPWFFVAIGIFIIGYLFALSLVLAIWSAKDIRQRTRSRPWRLSVPLIVFVFNMAGFLPYVVLRPHKTLAEKKADELELAIISKTGYSHKCPTCQKSVEADFLFCPHCSTSFKAICECGAALEIGWQHCAYCGLTLSKTQKKQRRAAPQAFIDKSVLSNKKSKTKAPAAHKKIRLENLRVSIKKLLAIKR